MTGGQWYQLLRLLREFGRTELDQHRAFRVDLGPGWTLYVRFGLEQPAGTADAYELIEVPDPAPADERAVYLVQDDGQLDSIHATPASAEGRAEQLRQQLIIDRLGRYGQSITISEHRVHGAPDSDDVLATVDDVAPRCEQCQHPLDAHRRASIDGEHYLVCSVPNEDQVECDCREPDEEQP